MLKDHSTEESWVVKVWGVIESDDSNFWFFDDKLHRTDGPAIEWKNGNRHWYSHGKLHRTDGPAIEYYNGTKIWCINGKKITTNEVDLWIKENNIPEDHNQWTDDHKMLFKLTFS
jgi:hypothetical protein